MVGVLAALLIGGLMGFLHALFSIRYRMDQIISGTVIIVLATGITSYLFDRRRGQGKFGAIRIPLLADIPVIGDVLFNNAPITYLALILVAVLHVTIFYRAGACCAAVREHPNGGYGGYQRQPLPLHQHDIGRHVGRAGRRFFGAGGGGPISGGHDGRKRLYFAGRHDLWQLESFGALAAGCSLAIRRRCKTSCCWPASPPSRASL
ncbi:MAG: hypothetical protein R2911_32375 [Caldilineaceae bacterium]